MQHITQYCLIFDFLTKRSLSQYETGFQQVISLLTGKSSLNAVLSWAAISKCCKKRRMFDVKWEFRTEFEMLSEILSFNRLWLKTFSKWYRPHFTILQDKTIFTISVHRRWNFKFPSNIWPVFWKNNTFSEQLLNFHLKFKLG